MLKIGMISGWHVHARGYAEDLQSREDVEISVIWDEEPQRGKEWAKDLGVDYEPKLKKMLKKYDLDGVVVNAPTNRHPEVIVKAAKAGKHIFTEKVMALTVKECQKIVDAVETAGVKFCISFPFRTRPSTLFAKKMVDNDELGDISLIRVRNAHDGASSDWLPEHFYDKEQCGGGAMMDLGAHGMYLIRWFLDNPGKITSAFTNLTGHEVEDNAVSMIEFENQAVAINETGFVTPGSPFSLEIHGTEGTLFIGGDRGGVRYNTQDTDGWVTVEDLPEPLPEPICQWVDALQGKGEIRYDLEDGIQLTELMENAYKSNRKDKHIKF